VPKSSLLDQAILVSEELIRVAITEFEAWHEAIDDSSRLFFNEGNIEAMLKTLYPLHLSLRKPPETTLQTTFMQTYSGTHYQSALSSVFVILIPS